MFTKRTSAFSRASTRPSRKADVLFVEVDVHEAPDLAFIIADPVFKPREPAVQRLDQGLDVRGGGFDLAFAPSQGPQGRGNTHLYHGSLPLMVAQAERLLEMDQARGDPRRPTDGVHHGFLGLPAVAA